MAFSTFGLDEIAKIDDDVLIGKIQIKIGDLRIKIFNSLLKIIMIHLLFFLINKNNAFITHFLSLHLLRYQRFLDLWLWRWRWRWGLWYFHDDRLVCIHVVGVVDHLRQVGWVLVLLSFQQRFVYFLNNTHIRFFLQWLLALQVHILRGHFCILIAVCILKRCAWHVLITNVWCLHNWLGLIDRKTLLIVAITWKWLRLLQRHPSMRMIILSLLQRIIYIGFCFSQGFAICIEILQLDGISHLQILLIVDGWTVWQIGSVDLLIDAVGLSEDILERRVLSRRLALRIAM